MIGWLGAFAFGQAIELPIYWRATKGRWFIAFMATALTHPIVWFVFPRLFDDFVLMCVAAETFAILVEAAWLRLFRVPHPLAWSFAANAASFTLGLASSVWLGWP